jgi:hypothetical protein
VDHQTYQILEEAEKDYMMIVLNAEAYNEADSQIVADAHILQVGRRKIGHDRWRECDFLT